MIVDFLERIDDRHAGMRNRGGCPGLGAQALAQPGRLRDRWGQRLQRDASSKPLVFREVDDAHAAAAQFLDDDVVADTRAWWQRVEIGWVDLRGFLEERACRLV